MSKLLKIAIMFAIPLVMWFITPPEGLSVEAWRLLGFYLMAIVGLVVIYCRFFNFLKCNEKRIVWLCIHYSMASILCVLPQCGVCKNRTWPSYCVPID